MSIKLLVYLVAAGIVLYLRWSRGRKRAHGARTVAEKYDLQFDDDSMKGIVQGRDVHAYRVRRGSRRYAEYSFRFEVKLGSPPADLRIGTEGAISTLSKVVGVNDLCVGDAVFDGEFVIGCPHESVALEWLTPDRCEALLSLRRMVNEIRIEEGWLLFEVPADPYDSAEIERALSFAVGVAETIDDPVSMGPLPVLEIEGLRATRGKWNGAYRLALAALPFVMIAGFAGWVYYRWGSVVRAMGDVIWQGGISVVHDGTDLQACLDGLDFTFDVDPGTCADEAVGVTPETITGTKALRTYQQLLLRKAERVDLDPDAAAAAIEGLVATSPEEDRETEIVGYLWDAGLPIAYAEHEDWHAPSLETTARAVATLGTMTERARDLRGYAAVQVATQCLLGVASSGFAEGSAAGEVLAACEVVAPPKDNETPTTVSVQDDDGYVAKLEADPEPLLDAMARRILRSPQSNPKTALYIAALELARGTDPGELPLEAIAKASAPVRCEGAWAPGESFGSPEIWRKAAKVAGPLASLMRTHAVVQDRVMGRFDALDDELNTDDPNEAICVAQMEIAAGNPSGALERLDGLEAGSDLAPWLHYTRAQAHFIQRQWAPAAQEAVTALHGFPMTVANRDLRGGAALFAIAAQLHAPDPGLESILDENFGAAPLIDELTDDDSVGTARWFADAARGDLPDADVRWGAPATLPLVQGAEIASFYIAGEFAENSNRSYWLDTLLPLEFDPFGVATGRLQAAKLRDDATAAKSWQEVWTKLQALVDSPSAARLRRRAFP